MTSPSLPHRLPSNVSPHLLSLTLQAPLLGRQVQMEGGYHPLHSPERTGSLGWEQGRERRNVGDVKYLVMLPVPTGISQPAVVGARPFVSTHIVAGHLAQPWCRNLRTGCQAAPGVHHAEEGDCHFLREGRLGVRKETEEEF